MERAGPIDTGRLLEPLHDELIALLNKLTAEDWLRPTLAGTWQARDVAAHILDGDLRKLSAYRDGHILAPSHDISSFQGLTTFLNELNGEWIAAARRLSPGVLLDLLRVSGPQVAALLAGLPPHGPSLFAVSWAGETRSENWLDTGREYTERWHHQMQIREAVGAELLLQRRWFHPLIELSLRALPRAYGEVVAEPDRVVVVEVRGDGGGIWSLVALEGRWELWRGAVTSPAVRISLDGDIAWRLFYKAISGAQARAQSEVQGLEELAAPFFRARAVMV